MDSAPTVSRWVHGGGIDELADGSAQADHRPGDHPAPAGKGNAGGHDRRQRPRRRQRLRVRDAAVRDVVAHLECEADRQLGSDDRQRQ
ncbi:MAG TPA: hypothetical protein VFH30_08285 [Acidimicrobiales bacterium]|nr:hypothetical protein [Acidimicrobiales bacterium]